ncbi:F0F1 ATP synthase subunit A, partial [bacterium]|nr:F0F1 ATP synthase subunit A [bacterium]
FYNIENQILIGSTCLVVLFILLGVIVARRHVGVVSEGWGAVFEMFYDFVEDMSMSFMGERGRRYTPFAVSVFLFVLLCNWSGLLPVPSLILGGEHSHHIFEAPTASYNTTLALAIVSFFAFTFYGLQQKISGDPKPSADDFVPANLHLEEGHGLFAGFFVWLKHYLGEVSSMKFDGIARYTMLPALAILFCFLNVVEEVARLVSLSFRLYGNIYGEHQVKANLLDSADQFLRSGFAEGSSIFGMIQGVILAVLLWAISLFVMFLGVLAGGIQAFVFCILTISYIGHVVGEEE